MLTIHPVDPDLRVEITGRDLDLPAHVELDVETLWQAELARRPSSLFNGPLFSVRSFARDRIAGQISEYRRFIAQRRNPALRNDLDVRPLGVTGVHLCRGGLVFCRRADDVEMHAGRWESSPTGSVDGAFLAESGDVDIRAQLLAELMEETGVPREALTDAVQPFALVEDDETGVVDVGMLIRTGLSEAEVGAAFAARHTREYVSLEVVDLARLDLFLRDVEAVSRVLVSAAVPLL